MILFCKICNKSIQRNKFCSRTCRKINYLETKYSEAWDKIRHEMRKIEFCPETTQSRSHMMAERAICEDMIYWYNEIERLAYKIGRLKNQIYYDL